MRYTLTPEKAIILLKDVAAARHKWGKNVSPPVKEAVLLEAIELAADAGCFDSNRMVLTPEERTKINRARGMAKARELRHSKLPEDDNNGSVSEE